MRPDKPVQLELPFLNGDDRRTAVAGAVVEVVIERERLRVRPRDFPGWVRFPKALREIGTRYLVGLLKPAAGGAWIATGNIRKLSGR